MTGPVTMTTKSQRKVLNRGERLLKAGDSEGPLVIVRVKSQPWASQGNTQRLFSSFLDCLTYYDSLLKKKRATAWIATQFDCLQIPPPLINMQLLQCYIFVPFSSSLPWQQERGREETEDSVSASLVLGAGGTPERPLIASNHFQWKEGLACCSRLNCLLCKLRLIMGRRFLAGNWMHGYVGGGWRNSQEIRFRVLTLNLFWQTTLIE